MSINGSNVTQFRNKYCSTAHSSISYQVCTHREKLSMSVFKIQFPTSHYVPLENMNTCHFQISHTKTRQFACSRHSVERKPERAEQYSSLTKSKYMYRTLTAENTKTHSCKGHSREVRIIPRATKLAATNELQIYTGRKYIVARVQEESHELDRIDALVFNAL